MPGATVWVQRQINFLAPLACLWMARETFTLQMKITIAYKNGGPELLPVQLWLAPGATCGIIIAGKGYDGDAPDLLAYPSDVWLDKNGNVFIADGTNYRVQEYTVQSTIDSTYIPMVPGNYSATVFAISGCSAISNLITVYPYVTPQVSVNRPTGKICAGSFVTFHAVSANGGTAPSFQWEINGVIVGTDNA